MARPFRLAISIAFPSRVQHNTGMRKRSSKKPQPQAPNQSGLTSAKNPAAVALGKLGGAKGGKARAAKLTAEQRREIAKRAAQARWANKK
jgi:hypothetical protein